ncbi:MAG: three-Cys-motif partner protein TcmP [archaeon]|nr:three-Cys-motif partner protein TcmP [archaeon]
MAKLEDRDWIIKHLGKLMQAGKEILDKSTLIPTKESPTYDKGYWTGLKLILLKYYLKPYLDILAQRKRVAYIDLFAGPGLTRIGDSKVPVPGSPLIPLTLKESNWQFSSFIFSELDIKYYNALKERISLINPSVKPQVFQEDANNMVERLPILLKGIDHALVFLDPEGMEMRWESLAKLCKSIDCDLIINFPSSGVVRNLHNSQTALTIENFLGTGGKPIPPEAGEEWAIKLYRDNLMGIGKDISTEIKVSSGEGDFHYHLIPAVKTTAGKSPWFNPIFGEAKKKIERMTGHVLGFISEQIEGKQSTL